MIQFSIDKLVPKFILDDRNGYAMAKAIEVILVRMAETVQEGMDTVLKVDTMPEWRLDEMAWELGCLYDYTAEVEEKRRWVRDSMPLFAAYGTPQAIYNYLQGVFSAISVEEFWQYGGDPYHFRVTVEGTWNAQKQAWMQTAIVNTKNVRSVLDSIAVGSICRIAVGVQGGVLARILYPMCGTALCGQDSL
jgi:phage tail P2-like protein